MEVGERLGEVLAVDAFKGVTGDEGYMLQVDRCTRGVEEDAEYGLRVGDSRPERRSLFLPFLSGDAYAVLRKELVLTV